jgi:hypothetical protein
MKTLVYNTFILLALLFVATTCTDKVTVEQNVNVPVYMDYATLRSAVRSSEARDLLHPGKIYFKDNYLLIVEYLEGIHVIDISNPESPLNRVFIEIPGCTDLAIKANALYADSYVDLVVIDITQFDAPKEVQRFPDLLPHAIPAPDDQTIPYASVDVTRGIVVDWEVKREMREYEYVYVPSYPLYDYAMISEGAYLNTSSGGGNGASASFGKGGSMARFGLYDNYLYIAEDYFLHLFEVSEPAAPVKSTRQPLQVNGRVETMFIYLDHMFFGTPSGMVVYSLKVPSYPQLQNNFWHVTSCDPVVVQDDYAYITLRGGTTCNNSTINRLDVVQCTDNYSKYALINSYPLTEPFGLGIDGNTLFVCDGRAGLKVYDATDKRTIDRHLLASFPDIQAYDVIPIGGLLFLIGEDGFYLYDYSDIQHIRRLGHIPVVKQS